MIAIEYETFGEPAAPPVLLVMGLGGQHIHKAISYACGNHALYWIDTKHRSIAR